MNPYKSSNGDNYFRKEENDAINKWAVGFLVVKFSITKEISVVFHNAFNFDYHFSIKEFGKEFEGEFSFLEENTEKCKTHSVSITREVKRADKNGNEITKRHILLVTIYW